MATCEGWFTSKAHYSSGLREAAYCALALHDIETVARLYPAVLEQYRYNKPWGPEYKYIHLFEDMPARMALMLGDFDAAERMIQKLLNEKQYSYAYNIAIHHPHPHIAHSLIRQFEVEGLRPSAISLAAEIGDFETAKQLLEQVVYGGIRTDDLEFNGFRNFIFVLHFPELSKLLASALEQTSYGLVEAGRVAALLGDNETLRRVKERVSEPHILMNLAGYAGDTQAWQQLFITGVRSLNTKPKTWMDNYDPMGKNTNWVFLPDIEWLARRSPEACERVLKPLAQEGYVIGLLAAGILKWAYQFPQTDNCTQPINDDAKNALTTTAKDPVLRNRAVEKDGLQTCHEETRGDVLRHSQLHVMAGTDLQSGNAAPDQRGQPEAAVNTPSAAVLIGHEIATNSPVEIGERERHSGLYVLGKPRMGKSTLFVNMIAQDIEQGRSVFFLDPHGQAITDLFERYPHLKFALDKQCVYLLDPTDNDYSFGLNPLFCSDVSSLAKRQRAYDKTFSIFKRIWEKENQWGVWLERILQSMVPLFIELQQYTLAEMPLFLNDRAFRAHILDKVRYNIDLLDYWQYEYEEKQAQSARNRVGSLLSDERVRHIIGQLKPTINFEHIVKSDTPQFVFLRLPANLSDPTKHFIGTIIVTELFYAIETRKGSETADTFCLYVDEFQHFATSQLARFIRESGKWGCAVALAHQDRRGQFRDNEDILGATLTCANRVVFQVNETDARELAVGFSQEPVALETRLIPEMVICKEPLWFLLNRGHNNPKVQDAAKTYLLPFQEEYQKLAEDLRLEGLIRQEHQDAASTEGYFSEGEPLQYTRNTAEEGHARFAARAHSANQVLLQRRYTALRQRITDLNKFLSGVMEGDDTVSLDTPRPYVDILRDRYQANLPVFLLYMNLLFNDEIYASIPAVIAHRWYEEEILTLILARVKESLEKQRDSILRFARRYTTWTRQAWLLKEGLKNVPADPSPYASCDLIVAHTLDDWNNAVKKRTLESETIIITSPFTIGAGRLLGGEVGLPSLPIRSVAGAERTKLLDYCEIIFAEHGREAESLKANIADLRSFFQSFRDPDNHILVSSGQYTEKAVSFASTQEMTNRAVKTLTDLPEYTAYAKILSENDGRRSTWSGRIATRNFQFGPQFTDLDLQEQALQLTRQTSCRPRATVQQEIVSRRTAWRKPEPPSPPKGQPSRTPEKVQQEPPSPWTEC